MKIIILIFFIVTLTACTHTKVSNIELLSSPEKQLEFSENEKKELPININAYKSCYSSRSGNYITTRCSSLSNVRKVVNIFSENGLKAVPDNNKSASTPYASLETDEFNGFLRGVTSFFNIITLGILPRYDYQDYIFTYEDPVRDISIKKEVRVSSTKSWFSMFLFNHNSLGKREMKNIAEVNLIRSVLNDAEIKEK